MKYTINFVLVSVVLLGSMTGIHANADHTFAKADTTLILKTSGNCGMCKSRIEQAAKIKGVSTAVWDADSQLLTVTLDAAQVTKNNIKAAVADAGHDIDGLQAEDHVYNALPDCCLYRDGNPHAEPSVEHAHGQDGDRRDGAASFTVAGACGMCKTRIEEAAKGRGLQRAVWDVNTQILTLTFEERFDLEGAKKRILAAGHDVEDRQADQIAYNKLPECCLYKDENNVHRLVPETQHHQGEEHILTGVVMQENNRGELKPIESANIFWIEDNGITATTDANGVFKIEYEGKLKNLVVSFAGYQSDTLVIKNPREVVVVTARNNVLAEVTVTARRSSNYIAALSPTRLEVLTGQELFKAACCDLSESFETNASVDVVSADAVTGSKQIQMLGLSGNYTMLTVENLPGPRGLATPLGLNSISGTWIESIQISKGIGSVVNGFENMAGQINVELKKPENSEQLFFNVYSNNMGRTDLNLNLSHQFNERWSSGFLLHDNFMFNRHMNFSNNGFRDVPIGNLFSGINRWRYENGKGFILQFGVKFLSDKRTGGEIAFDPSVNRLGDEVYGLGFDINRYEAFAKIGYVFPQNTQRSIGLQLSGSVYDQNSYFGQRIYNADQKNGYANLIYQDIIGNVEHKYRTGVSVQYDRYNELYTTLDFNRTEAVSGVFLEYTYSPSEKFDAVAGVRADYNNLYGWFGTPRLHLRYQPATGSTFRFSGGRGQRTANIFAENTAALASSRQVNIVSPNQFANAYGLNPEVVWNSGISFDQAFNLFNRQASLSIEFFRNDFTNQVVVDYENPRELSFYNLEGKSFSNSLQTEFRFMPFPHFEARAAYRFFDVRTTFGNDLLQRPLVARHRGFVNLAYATHSGGWHFDYTLNIVGQKRLASTVDNPVAYQMPDFSPNYVTMSAQVSKTFGKARPIDVYIGGENLSNFFQSNPIIAADQPFSDFFDTSMLWGPVTGRMFYIGMRLAIN